MKRQMDTHEYVIDDLRPEFYGPPSPWTCRAVTGAALVLGTLAAWLVCRAVAWWMGG